MFCVKRENINIQGEHIKQILPLKTLLQKIISLALYIAAIGIIVVRLCYLQENTRENNVFIFCAAMILIYCSIMYIREEYILPSKAASKRKDTVKISKQIHDIKNEEMIKLLIVEYYCPVIQRVYLEDKGNIRLIGNHTVHTLTLEDDGVQIVSAAEDSRADIEANTIMHFLMNCCECE